MRFFILLTFIFLLPELALADSLIACGGPGTGLEPCQACHLVALTNNVISWIFLILATLAGIVLVYIGYLFVLSRGESAQIQKGQRMFANIIVGMVIVFVAWLGVRVLLDRTAAGDVDGLFNVSCVEQNPFNTQLNPSTPVSVGLAGGAIIDEACKFTAAPPLGTQTDCADQEAACLAGNGVPEIDTTDPSLHTIKCTYSATAYAGSCDPVADPSNPCHESHLSIFGDRAAEASIICNKESGGAPVKSGADLCCGPGGDCDGAPSFSGGYFQINVLAHADKIDGCTPGAFYEKNGTEGTQGDCVRRNDEGICTGWSCSITDVDMYNRCMLVTTNSTLNFEIAETLFNGRGQNFGDWVNSANRCGIPL